MYTAFTPRPRATRGRPLAILALLTGLALFSTQGQAETPSPMGPTGQVEVNFVQPDGYADIGRSSVDREHNLRTLGEHFQRLGLQLPAGQRLLVEVLDVDLAGELHPHLPYELRVLRGGVDWPRITLRYSLRAGDATLAQGEERLSDASYLFTRRGLAEHQPLPHERRMLDAWFKQRFASQHAAAAR